MGKQYSFNSDEQTYVKEYPRVISQVIADYDLTIYQSRLLEERIENEMSKFFHATGIKTIRHKPMMKGAGGEDFLSLITGFYHTHQMLFGFLKLIPGLIQVIRSLIINFHTWYAKESLDLITNKPRVYIYFRIIISFDGYTKAMFMPKLKKSMEEFVNIIPEIEVYMNRKHPELKFTYGIISHWSGEKSAIAIYNYSGQHRTLKRLIKKMMNRNNIEDETLIYTIKRNVLFRNFKWGLQINKTIL